MSRVYDNWERLVKAVLDREQLRRLALSASFSSSDSLGSSFDSLHVTGTSHNDHNGVGVSATSSSASQSRFPDDLSDSSCLYGEILPQSCLKIYSFAELKSATRNFKSDLVLGVGGFGTVYKGWISEESLHPSKLGTGIMVAIYKLKPQVTPGVEKWKSDLNFVGRLSHPNLVKLLGFCWEGKEPFLVCEFMQKGSLENHLFGRQASIEPLSWDLRLKVAIGAARGLAFLHTSMKRVIYKGFNTSNILLDGNYNARIADFGLAILGPFGGRSSVHAAPEYIAKGHLYVKSDVYGFGVVLLEILTGLTALDMSRHYGKTNLVDWVKPLLTHKRKFLSVLEPRIAGQISSKAAQQAAQLAHRCLEPEPRKRPSMNEVVGVLEQISAVGKPKDSRSMIDKNKVNSKKPVIVNTRESANVVQNAVNNTQTGVTQAPTTVAANNVAALGDQVVYVQGNPIDNTHLGLTPTQFQRLIAYLDTESADNNTTTPVTHDYESVEETHFSDMDESMLDEDDWTC